MRSFVVLEKDSSAIKLESRLIDSMEALKPLANEKAWRIFSELAVHESYPAELTKKLGLGSQEVFYYIKRLRKAGLVKVVRREEKKGGLAKFYSTSEKCFSLVPDLAELERSNSFSAVSVEEKKLADPIKKFFEPFIVKGVLNAKIVVGSPDSHGEFRARARDAHLAVELASFLGMLSSKISGPLVFLDTMVRDLKEENSNLIVIGGPITNSLSRQINPFLSISFKQKNAHWVIQSSNSGKEYTEDNIGIVEKIQHPFFDSRSILFLAGKRNAGTRAAILSLIKNTTQTVKGNQFSAEKKAHAVEGLDLDSDGAIDGAELLE